MPAERYEKKIDNFEGLETDDSVVKASKKLQSKLKKEIVDEKLSKKDVDERFSKIMNKIINYGEGGVYRRIEYKTVGKDGKEEEVILKTPTTDEPPHLSIEIHKEGVTTFYVLYPMYKNGKIESYNLQTSYRAKNDNNTSYETMKNLSLYEVMQSLDKFEERIDEYRTETFDRMQQYAKKEDDQVDKTDKLA